MAMSRRYNHAMSPSFAPLKLLLMMFAGWVNRHQLDVIEYLQEENRVLKERLGGWHELCFRFQLGLISRRVKGTDVGSIPSTRPCTSAAPCH